MFQFMILLGTFPPSPFGLKRIFEKVGKWKIFRFVGKSSLTKNIQIDRILEEFSPFANVRIHLILLEKFPLSPFGLKIGTLTGPDKKSDFRARLVLHVLCQSL